MDEPSHSWAESSPAFAAALLDADAPIPSFLGTRSGTIDPRRFAVYRNNVMVSLVRALEANFPSVVRLLGEEFFAAMAQVYAASHPPRSPLMFHYGDTFPAFLESFEPARPYPYLADVARIEVMWRQAFHEADAPALLPADFAALPPEQLAALRFQAHPAARIVRSAYAAGSIFSANRQHAGPQPIDPLKGESALVTRPALDCQLRILPNASGLFIKALVDGSTMEAAAAAAFGAGEPFDFAATIGVVIEAGVFTSIHKELP